MVKTYRLILTVVLSILFISTYISAVCEEGQININSASAEELDKLYGIGPVKAQTIIDYRTDVEFFDSVNDLIDVKGIGNATLSGIKSQGLACVDNEIEDEEIKEISNNETSADDNLATDSYIKPASEDLSLKPIELNPQIIKTNNSESDENNYAIYGLFAFGILILTLFALKNWKKRNELQ